VLPSVKTPFNLDTTANVSSAIKENKGIKMDILSTLFNATSDKLPAKNNRINSPIFKNTLTKNAYPVEDGKYLNSNSNPVIMITEDIPKNE
jgi:hypothetical protein